MKNYDFGKYSTYAPNYKGIEYDESYSFFGVFTNEGIRDLFFVKHEEKNLVLICDRSYVYGAVDHFNILKAYELEKSEGNILYTEIMKSKFISKKGKTFYKTNRI